MRQAAGGHQRLAGERISADQPGCQPLALDGTLGAASSSCSRVVTIVVGLVDEESTAAILPNVGHPITWDDAEDAEVGSRRARRSESAGTAAGRRRRGAKQPSPRSVEGGGGGSIGRRAGSRWDSSPSGARRLQCIGRFRAVSSVCLGSDGHSHADRRPARIPRPPNRAEWEKSEWQLPAGWAYGLDLVMSCPDVPCRSRRARADLLGPMRRGTSWAPFRQRESPASACSYWRRRDRACSLGGSGGPAIVVRVPHPRRGGLPAACLRQRAACEGPRWWSKAVVWPSVPDKIAGEHVYRGKPTRRPSRA
jgi:hypothetical protein